jgi:hypothetical protein
MLPLVPVITRERGYKETNGKRKEAWEKLNRNAFAYLGPFYRERVHVHDVEPAREGLVEHVQRRAERAQPVDVRAECLGLVCELGECGLEEPQAVWRVCVCA